MSKWYKPSLSLGAKCRLAFAAAVLVIIGAALYVPYLWMDKLVEQGKLELARAEIQHVLARHFKAVEGSQLSGGAGPLALSGAESGTVTRAHWVDVGQVADPGRVSGGPQIVSIGQEGSDAPTSGLLQGRPITQWIPIEQVAVKADRSSEEASVDETSSTVAVASAGESFVRRGIRKFRDDRQRIEYFKPHSEQGFPALEGSGGDTVDDGLFGSLEAALPWARPGRYLRAVRADGSCLGGGCHASGTGESDADKDVSQGPRSLAEGELVGVISVVLPAGQTSMTLLLNRILIVVAGLSAGICAIVAFYLITQRVILGPVRRLRAAAEMMQVPAPAGESNSPAGTRGDSMISGTGVATVEIGIADVDSVGAGENTDVAVVGSGVAVESEATGTSRTTTLAKSGAATAGATTAATGGTAIIEAVASWQQVLEQTEAIKTGDEFEELAVAFRQMLTRLKLAQDRLRETNRALDLRLGELEAKNVALFESNKLKTEFLANVSHELRTPLNAIIGFAEILREQHERRDDKKGLRYVCNVEASGKLLLALINDLLDLAKIEAGKVELHCEQCQVNEIAEALLNFTRPLAEEKQLKVTLAVDEQLDVVTTDPGKLQQILFNLLSNAIKFTPAGGQIDIAAEVVDEDRFCLSVGDTGPGIAPVDRQTIFEKFRQLDGSVTREHAGTGLGLTIVKELVHMLGGTISVSGIEGQGAVFTVVLPRCYKNQG